MDVAWGANDGDETGASAQTAQAAASGEIFEQHYTPWNGTLNPRWMRNWAILRHHVLGVFSKGHRPWSMPTRIFILITFLAAMGDAALTLVSSLFGESELHAIFGVSRDNLYGHVLGFFPRNTLYYPSLRRCWSAVSFQKTASMARLPCTFPGLFPDLTTWA